MDHVSVAYPHGKDERKVVIGNIHLQIEPGEFVVLLGETGCGKSTLLKLILGQERASAGSISVNGKPVSRISANCGYVPQRYSLFPDRTALGNVMLGPETSQFPALRRFDPRFYAFRRTLRIQALDQLRQMGLRPADAAKYPHQLSGGMQQRVAIAQALMMQPTILLMDEAFSALDPATRNSLQALLVTLWHQTRPTVVFVTHNTAEALHLGTRLIVLATSQQDPSHGSQVVLDFKIPQSDLPIAERRHAKDFLEMIEFVEQYARGLRPVHPSAPQYGERA